MHHPSLFRPLQQPQLPTRHQAAPGAACPNPGQRHRLLHTLLALLGLLLALCWPARPALAAATAATPLTAIDLPACEQAAPGSATPWSLGLVQPGAADDVLLYAARLTLTRDDVQACQEGWHQVLPRFTPLARQLERGHGLALYALAFVLAAVGLRLFTPRAWWGRTRALGLLALAGLTWAGGTLLLAGFHLAQGQRLVYGTVVSLRTPQQAQPLWHSVADARALEAWLAQHGINTRLPVASGTGAAPATAGLAPADDPAHGAGPGPEGSPPAAGPAGPGSAEASAQPPADASADPTHSAHAGPQGRYRVAHRLNLRQGPGTQHPWLATLNRGDTVSVTGPAQGDWWPIETASGQQGWASSLWLRRPGEALPQLLPGERG